MRKAVFFDIDGTILDNKKGVIYESTVDAIRQLRRNGNYAFLCSGRTKAFIRNEQLLGIGFDGILAGCGTYIEYGNQVLYQKFLEEPLLTNTVKRLKQYRMPQVLEGPEYLFLDEADFSGDPFLNILQAEMGSDLHPITGNEKNWNCHKISVNLVAEHIEDILNEVRDQFEIMIHGNEFMELVPKGHTKASGIQYICDYLGISREDTLAIGDSRNDVEMLQYVGTGIAMGNGTKEAFDAADFITKPIDEDGLAYALEHFKLI